MKYLIIAIILFSTVTCFAEPLSYWQDQASFYESNFPYCTKNEKAMMLYKAMTDAGDKDGILLEKKEYKVEEIIIYKAGTKVWPINSSKPSKSSIRDLFRK